MRWFVLLLLTPLTGTAAEKPLDFNRDIRPILSNNCYACHGPDAAARKGDLRLDNRKGALGEDGGSPGIVVGKPKDSEIIYRVRSTEESEVMPPPHTGKKLKPEEIEILERWIQNGADYAQHWSYVPPKQQPIPKLPEALQKRVRNPIDAFILSRLSSVALQPSPEADRAILIRRVSLDLIGLPPTWEEVQAFVNDESPNAYEKLIDRLLAKPAFGEHWARMWLDLARYADSAGYADDPGRTIWAFRDYVIQSFNANKPFDQFTLEQMAGDLLPNPTEEQLIATAFHRNTMTNSEGGTNDEEFRNAAIVDRVNTTMAVWMGTSLACAQCHTHKYDPITQKEYFQLFAFFNNTADADRKDESPVLEIGVTPEQQEQRKKLEQQLRELQQKLKKSPDDKELKKQQAELTKQVNALKPKTTVPIFRELPENQRRVTKIQVRGSFLDLGEAVMEGVPVSLHPLPQDAPKTRLSLARWLIDAQNPLTARVTVNRFWEHLFGTGIVSTSEEFGSQGELPSHPDLLDWLALEFQRGDNGLTAWDMKRILKLMVTSATYRQSSRIRPNDWEIDADNRYLARGPRFRLGAEVIRDQALAVSGLLSSKMHGPSVRPYRPNMGLRAAFGGGLDWNTSQGEDRHRRGLYTEWRRTSPYPSMITFDAPSREACTIRRIRTNTPLQALVTLNDPVYIEAAQALARKLAVKDASPDSIVKQAFQNCLSRNPTAKETERVLQLFSEAQEELKTDPAKATQLAIDPIGALPKGADAVDLAAWTTVMNVILNLDEFLMKR